MSVRPSAELGLDNFIERDGNNTSVPVTEEYEKGNENPTGAAACNYIPSNYLSGNNLLLLGRPEVGS
jgi:hypothetical protein